MNIEIFEHFLNYSPVACDLVQTLVLINDMKYLTLKVKITSKPTRYLSKYDHAFMKTVLWYLSLKVDQKC